jgi:cytochrome P450
LCDRSNANSVPAACWFLYEILKNATLESKVREEIDSAQLLTASPTQVPRFDIEKLCAGPRLQSIYAETLRLRVAILASRRCQVPEMQFRGWSFKYGECVAVATSIESRDEEVWSQGSGENLHPLNEFWAERFLIYPDDPTSGPLKQPKAVKGAVTTMEGDTLKKSNAPRFSMDGLTTAWIPYSGGQRLCPGRHFAKQEMISASAIMLSAFDIELLEPTRNIRENKAFYGFGTMPPKDKIKVRIRRRAR